MVSRTRRWIVLPSFSWNSIPKTDSQGCSFGFCSRNCEARSSILLCRDWRSIEETSQWSQDQEFSKSRDRIQCSWNCLWIIIQSSSQRRLVVWMCRLLHDDQEGPSWQLEGQEGCETAVGQEGLAILRKVWQPSQVAKGSYCLLDLHSSRNHWQEAFNGWSTFLAMA